MFRCKCSHVEYSERVCLVCVCLAVALHIASDFRLISSATEYFILFACDMMYSYIAWSRHVWISQVKYALVTSRDARYGIRNFFACNMTREYKAHDSFMCHVRGSATHCSTLQHTATHCYTLLHTATHCNTLQHTAAHCNTLHHTATHCNTMQHSATHCNTL